MFDFDVLGISVADEPRPDDALALDTVHLDVPVGEVARGPAVVLAPEISVGGAIAALRRSRHGAAVVVREQRPVGVVTDHDLLAHASAANDVAVVSVMSTCREPLRATASVGASLRRMCETRQWHQPLVCERGLLVGAIDLVDLMLWLRDRMTLLSVDAALGAAS